MGLFEDYRNLLGQGVATVGKTFGLPELGLSERVSSNKNTTVPLQTQFASGFANLTGSSSQGSTGVDTRPVQGPVAGPTQQASGPNINNPLGGNPYANSGYAGAGSAGDVSILSSIDAEYNNSIKALDNQTGETNAGFATSSAQLNNQANVAKADISDLQGQAVTGLGEQASQTQLGATNALNDARGAYNELQQRNNAQLSASGLGNSSVNEALGETLNRRTFDALNQIGQNRDTVLANIGKETQRAKDFYSRKTVEVSTALQQAQSELSNQLNAALNRISEAKTATATKKEELKRQTIAQARAAYQQVNSQAANWQKGADVYEQSRQQIFKDLGFVADGKFSIQEFMARANETNKKLKDYGLQYDIPTMATFVTSRVPLQPTSFLVPYEKQPNIMGQTPDASGNLPMYDPTTGKRV